MHPSCNSSTGSHLASSSSPVVFSLSLSLSPHQQTSEVYHENPNTSLLGFLLICYVMFFLRCMLDKEDSSDASTPHPTHTRPKKKKKKNTHQSEILSRSRGWVVIIVVLPRFRSKHSTPTQHKGLLLLYPADFCCNTRRERTSKRLNPFPKSSPL